ncbi:hypothetical protein M947_03425 [Sulfurimonas hongkongensis]|uniref:OmpA-like domain-containing protein n=1 Tax=Sulfurimonas hongkongensis TaxID=1172190 RepID=T0JPI3_9BACT|nr:hypothetical protein [Sulfurimonas hongkongensis]EQB40086.1 hypothetical protein M947_03425 [Sulfurimonas hongkongensis]
MRILISLLLLLSLIYAKSSDFSIIVKKPFNNALFDITQDYDGGISAVGFSKEYKNTNNSQSKTYTNAFDYLASVSDTHGPQMHLIKIDDFANITLSKATKMSSFSEAVALVKTPSNGYFVGGHTMDGSLIILKLDSNGNTIFSKSFGTKNYDRMSKLIKLSDGGVLAVGSSTTTRSIHDKLFETGLGLNDIFLARFSKSGMMLWSKKFGTKHDDSSIDAVEARDGSILVLGTTSYDKQRDVTLMRVSQNGDKIWLKHYKSDTRITPHKIIKLRDGNFLVSLSQKDEMKRDQVRLIKFDLQNNVIIDNTINTAYASGLKDIKEYSDGTIIGVGYVKDTFNTDALVMMCDSNLQMLHQEHFGEENYDMLNAVTILENSQAAAAGIYTYKNEQNSNMWIVKINRDATIAQTSKKSMNIYDSLLELFADEIDAKKLRIKEDLTIEFLSHELLFKVGEYKLTEAQKIFLNRVSSRLVDFLYRHKEFIDTLEVNGHTSSEWSNTNFTNRYIKNAELSMQRSFETLSHIFKKQELKKQEWLSDVLKGSGLSYSKRIMHSQGENREYSRRVTFKILLKQKK